MKDPLTTEQANDIYDVLMALAGASEGWRRNFVSVQTAGFVTEYRFQGILGFGGKFWRNYGRRPDGSWGEIWYVDCYREDQTTGRLEAIANTNYELEILRRRTNA